MPAFIKKTLLYITSYSQLLALLGVGLMVFSVWGQWRAEGDHAYTQREQLQTVTGFVKEAGLYTKKKRGREVSKYYQIEVVPEDSAEALKLKIRYDVPEEWIGNLVEEQVTVLYDSDKEVYEAVIDGEEPQLTYEGTRDHLLSEAKSTADTFSGPIFWVFCVILLLTGIGSFVVNRKLKRGLA